VGSVVRSAGDSMQNVVADDQRCLCVEKSNFVARLVLQVNRVYDCRLAVSAVGERRGTVGRACRSGVGAIVGYDKLPGDGQTST